VLAVDEKDLFEKVLRKWGSRADCNEKLTLKQIAALVLGSGTADNASRIGHLFQTFRKYFCAPRYDGYHWRVKWLAVKEDHHDLFHEVFPPRASDEPAAAPSSAAAEMKLALDDEIKAVREALRQNPISASGASKGVQLSDGSFLYDAKVDLSTDADFPFPEGVNMRLMWPKPILPCPIQAILLSYEPLTSTMYFEVDQPLTERQRESHFFVHPCIEELIRAVQGQLERLNGSKQRLVWKLLQDEFRPESRDWDGATQISNLDETQERAVKECLKKDITFLWGPPGTGKTHTLGRVITTAALAGKTVLAASIANVAVDQIAFHLVKALVEARQDGESLLNNGKVLRFGHARLPEVTNDRRLFPNKEMIQTLRRTLHDLRQEHQKEKDASKRALLQNEIKNVTTQLRNLTKESIAHASIVLTTAVQTCIEPTLAEASFDVVVIDEASMMSLPYVGSVGMLAAERIVIAGDFQQLGPIAISHTDRAYRWLHKDPFAHVGISSTRLEHDALTMLTTQRRMQPEICELINRCFYGGGLRTHVERPKKLVTAIEPLAQQTGVFVNMAPSDGCCVEQTNEGSRRNVKSAGVVAALASIYAERHPGLEIGVIAPYRAQVSLIKRLLKERPLPPAIAERIRVGTVHAFQGSESDVVIVDLVESRTHKIGKIYHGATGDRLINVAISRAKDKLILVGDRQAFYDAPGHEMVNQLKKLLNTNFLPGSETLVAYEELKNWLGHASNEEWK
jgi:superfamily I DNA and/or RNA helicase